jgi:hypothetical protein
MARPFDHVPLPGVVFLLPLILAWPAQAHNGAVALAVPVEGITVDGDLSDWPTIRCGQFFRIGRGIYGLVPLGV